MRSIQLVVLLITVTWPSAAAQDQAQPTSKPATHIRDALMISDVTATPKRLVSLGEQDVSITFRINRGACCELRIRDVHRNVLRIHELGSLGPGTHTIKWDGRDSHGNLAQGHRFLYAIQGVDERGRHAAFDPIERAHGVAVKPRRFSHDSAKGRLSYVLPRPCMVRIRIGLRDGPLLRTLVDWEPQNAGIHEIGWDGRVASGAMSIGQHPQLDITLSAYAIPANVILVDHAVSATRTDGHKPNDAANARRRMPPDSNTYLHATCDLAHCHEPRFTVTFPKAHTGDADGLRVTGRTPVRITLDPRDHDYIVARRFEVMVYVDGVFVFEEESGTSPLTYHWDTKELVPGRHFVTVNIMSYDDHVGTVTHNVWVGAKQ